MKVRLDRVGDEPFDWQETLVLRGDELEDGDLLALGEIRTQGKIFATSTGYVLHASVAYEQTLGCTRCLEPVSQEVEAVIDLLVQVVPADGEAPDEGDEKELGEADLGLLVLGEPVLDTRPIVVEQVRLNVPMKALCRDDCAGLCGLCGADLNAGPCGCEEPADPRWSALAKLKEPS